MEAVKAYEAVLGEIDILDQEVDLTDLMHGYRVGELAVRIGKRAGMLHDELIDVYIAGIFHDVGKCMIDRKVRDKPGKLDYWERKIMEEHVRIGAGIGMRMNLSSESIRFILGHHENYDGSGYPIGCKGEKIPLGGRILKICDCYDALCMDRPYRKAYSLDKVFEIMEKEKKTFDPRLYQIFKEVIASENDA